LELGHIHDRLRRQLRRANYTFLKGGAAASWAFDIRPVRVSKSAISDGFPSRDLYLSQWQLVSAWANFARTGNPNGSGNAPWPRYTAGAETPAWLIQDAPGLSTLTDAQYAALRRCDFWDSVTATQ
jgi:hypothetical protein